MEARVYKCSNRHKGGGQGAQNMFFSYFFNQLYGCVFDKAQSNPGVLTSSQTCAGEAHLVILPQAPAILVDLQVLYDRGCLRSLFSYTVNCALSCQFIRCTELHPIQPAFNNPASWGLSYSGFVDIVLKRRWFNCVLKSVEAVDHSGWCFVSEVS